MNKRKKILIKFLVTPEVPILLTVMIVISLGLIISPNFRTFGNFVGILRNVSYIGIPSLFVTVLLISKGLDLSLDAVAALSSIIFAQLITKRGLNSIEAIAITLGVAMLIGVINSILILRIKIPSFIATLGMMFIAKGLSVIVAGGGFIMIDQKFSLMKANILGITPDVYIFLSIAIILFIIVKLTGFGRKIVLIGTNEKAASISGLRTVRIVSVLYILTSLGTSFAAILFTMRSSIGMYDCGSSWALQAITICVIGGTSLYGGKGSIIGTVLGAIFMGIVTNLMIMFGIEAEWQYVGTGVFMVLGILLDVWRNAKLQKVS